MSTDDGGHFFIVLKLSENSVQNNWKINGI